MYNPRWPHTFVIVPEYLDENGLPVTDENGDPCEPTEQLDENGLPLVDENGDPIAVSQPEEAHETDSQPQDEAGDEPEPTPVKHPSVLIAEYDSNWNPRKNSDGTFVANEVTEVPWGYRTSTGGMKTAGEVIVADYKISTPMCLTDIPTGTLLEMTDYTHTFLVKVIKATTYNWGTNLWVDNVKN